MVNCFTRLTHLLRLILAQIAAGSARGEVLGVVADQQLVAPARQQLFRSIFYGLFARHAWLVAEAALQGAGRRSILTSCKQILLLISMHSSKFAVVVFHLAW